MKRPKHTSLIALILVLCVLLSGCGRQEPVQEAAADVFSVYASFYPLYALADMLVENTEGVELHCLVQPQDGCLRDYALSDWDLALLTGAADAVIAGGRGLESFESLLYALGENGPVVSAMFYDMELINRRAINTQDDTDSHWLQDNPHIYMNVAAAQEITRRITSTLSMLNPENEAAYSENLKKALEQLVALQRELENELAALKGRPVIIMNEALVYAAESYGLTADLCYERESGEELVGADLENCLRLLSESEANVILLEKQAPQSLRKSLEDAGYRVALLDVISTRRAVEGSEGYFQAHRSNAQAILNAFAESN